MTLYRVLAEEATVCPWWNVILITGRTHQIRARSVRRRGPPPASADGKYGSERENRKYGRHGQALYSYNLTFRFTTDAGPLADLDGRTFQVDDVDFVEEFFPEYTLQK